MAHSRETHCTEDASNLNGRKNLNNDPYPISTREGVIAPDHATPGAGGDEDSVTEYERIREANLARNKAFLESLGVPALVSDIRSPATRSAPQLRKQGTGDGGDHTAINNKSTSLHTEKIGRR